jgi:type I restriction enzyme S subunit
VIRLQNVGDGVFNDADKVHISADRYDRLRKHEALAGDIVIAALGDLLPRACIIPDGIGAAIVKADCVRVRVGADADPRFLMWMLNAPPSREAAASLISGVGRPRLNLAKIRSLCVPLPPMAEQRLIVEVIEEQLSRLAAAESSLRRVAKTLAKFAIAVRSSLLRGAWPTVQASEIAAVRLGRQRSPKNHFGPSMRPYLRAANVRWSGLDLSDVKVMQFSTTEAAIYELHPGDILIAEASGSQNEVGKSAIWRSEIPSCCFQNTLLRARPGEKVIPEYLLLVFQLAALSGSFGQAALGVGIHHLGAQRMSGWPVPLPSLGEQRRILSDLEKYISVADDVAKSIGAGVRRSQRLRGSILEAAFSGRLIPRAASVELVSPSDVPEGGRRSRRNKRNGVAEVAEKMESSSV